MCSLNDSRDAIKPNIKSERTTIILREIPSATPPADVEALFEGCGRVESVRSDVGDTWFVTMASEDEAVQTLLALRSKTFQGAAIKARLKSENVLKSFYPTQPVENTLAPAVGAAPYSGRGYFGTGAVGGYYDVASQYGAQYAPAGRGGAHAARGGRGQFRANRPSVSTHAKEGRPKSGSFEQQQRPASRKNKDKRAAKAAQQQQQPQQQQQHANGKKSERQPILNAANFPPLPATPAGDKPEARAITHQYAHEDIMEIVKNMDEADCALPAGKMDFEAHPAALTATAHPDLLRNQRTYSIEQAREAMRQGRPIRSDSVGSIDYESLMYGEDYTKEAREQRKQQAGEAPSESPAAASAKPAAAKPAADKPAPKIIGYAAAVINGTPAPAPVLEPKKKQPAKSKDEKKAKPATEDRKEAAAKPSTSASLPTAGAWGGRNFLDVVKSEPAAKPASPAVETKKTVAAASTPAGESK